MTRLVHSGALPIATRAPTATPAVATAREEAHLEASLADPGQPGPPQPQRRPYGGQPASLPYVLGATTVPCGKEQQHQRGDRQRTAPSDQADAGGPSTRAVPTVPKRIAAATTSATSRFVAPRALTP
ncbi:MAG TPA: hypothetical protein VFR74_15625, partial [Jiangellales bacterium]|nr:hypothetical protein [Jiangellales bacterium]